MASCRSVVILALSKLGIAGGGRAPRQEDLSLGLQTLQSLYRSLITSGTLGRANSVVASSDYTARENDRILRTAGCEIDIPLVVPALPWNGYPYGGSDYGQGYSCATRLPRNGAFVVINDALSGNSVEVIYDGHRNQWITVGDLTLDDNLEVRDADGVLLEVRTSEAPLSSDANGLSALLATHLSDHYRSDVQPATIRDAARFENSLAHRFGEDDDGLAWATYF